jgi:predicted nucleotidyltransferase
MLKFNNKNELFEYTKNKFKESKLILISGSTAYGKIKNFSDFDVEVYINNTKKPYYEIVFIKEKPILISIYFYKYKLGKDINPPKGIKVIKGKFNDKIDKKFTPIYGEGKYTKNEKLKRDCQLITDFCFKYFRSKDKRYLEYIQKRIK